MAVNQYSYWLNELNERLHPQQKYEQLAFVKKKKKTGFHTDAHTSMWVITYISYNYI